MQDGVDRFDHSQATQLGHYQGTTMESKNAYAYKRSGGAPSSRSREAGPRDPHESLSNNGRRYQPPSAYNDTVGSFYSQSSRAASVMEPSVAPQPNQRPVGLDPYTRNRHTDFALSGRPTMDSNEMMYGNAPSYNNTYTHPSNTAPGVSSFAYSRNEGHQEDYNDLKVAARAKHPSVRSAGHHHSSYSNSNNYIYGYNSSSVSHGGSSGVSGKNKPTHSNPLFREKAKQDSKSIEVSPGQFMRLRGADETWQAIQCDFFMPCECIVCSGSEKVLFCIQDAQAVLCPTCRVISPLDGPDGGGVGLGFHMEELAKWQNEIERERATRSQYY